MNSSKTTAAGVRELFCDEFKKESNYGTRRPQGGGDWLLIYTEGGGGRIQSGSGIEGMNHTRRGDVFVYSPQDAQDYRTDPTLGRWHLLWAHFLPRPEWLVWLNWPKKPSGLKLLHLEDEIRAEFRAAFQRTIRLSQRQIPGAVNLATNALERALLWANVAASKEKWTELDPRVRKAIDHLSTNLRSPFRLEELSRKCGASVSRLAHLFKEQTGSTPQQFLENQRIRHASQLLRRTDLKISEVAWESGYCDPLYFSNRFRRQTGKSPSEFRQDGIGK